MENASVVLIEGIAHDREAMRKALGERDHAVVRTARDFDQGMHAIEDIETQKITPDVVVIGTKLTDRPDVQDRAAEALIKELRLRRLGVRIVRIANRRLTTVRRGYAADAYTTKLAGPESVAEEISKLKPARRRWPWVR